LLTETHPPQGTPRGDCVARVHRAIDHVVSNLSSPLPLDVVARAAHFSPFHFHRVFRAVTGETLGDFVKRLRLEKALGMLAHHRPRSYTEVALACGFASSSDFSRCFRQRYGVAPSRFDLERHRATQRAALHATMPAAAPAADPNPDGFGVTLRDLPAFSVAYLRVADSYREGAVLGALRRLHDWATARDVASGAARRWFGYMWDDPEIVALADCRYDVAVQIDPSMAIGSADGAVGRFDFPAMRVAELPVRGDLHLELRALQWLFDRWLPTSGFVPAALPCFEAWVGEPLAQGTAHFELDLWLPVEPG
jgi:AraC family transcriptional regulator